MTDQTQRKRAKYISSSSPLPPPKKEEPKPEFSFCESVHATSTSPWHIRKLDGAGRKLGGGITTNSLCALVTRGWDLEVEVTEHHLKTNTCRRCATEYFKLQLMD